MLARSCNPMLQCEANAKLSLSLQEIRAGAGRYPSPHMSNFRANVGREQYSPERREMAALVSEGYCDCVRLQLLGWMVACGWRSRRQTDYRVCAGAPDNSTQARVADLWFASTRNDRRSALRSFIVLGGCGRLCGGSGRCNRAATSPAGRSCSKAVAAFTGWIAVSPKAGCDDGRSFEIESVAFAIRRRRNSGRRRGFTSRGEPIKG